MAQVLAHRPGRPRSIPDQLKTLAWVIPLTLLIWIYAEREQNTEEKGQLIRISLRSPEADRLVRLEAPQESEIYADLQGPRSRLDRVLRQLHGEGYIVNVNVDPNLPVGQEHVLRTLIQIANDPIFRDNSIEVRNPQPPILKVFLDEMVEREAKVVAPPDVTNLEGEPVFSPATAIVRAPRSVLDARPSPLVAQAHLSGRPELRQHGPHEIPNVVVSVPGLTENVTITPATVRANIEVSQPDVEFSIPSVPVYLTITSELADQYRVKHPKFVNNVPVIGPQRQIDFLSEHQTRARLSISSDDINRLGESITRRLEYDLPEGVRVKDNAPQVTFQLERREPE